MKIFLDAGHNNNGFDTGATGNGHREQDITYDIAKGVGELLIQHGFLVKYSRPNKTDNVGSTLSTSISGRYTAANSWGADLFISLHCNAATSNSAKGTETLVYSFGGSAEKLAKSINTAIVKDCGMTNRGIKQRTDLGVLRSTNMPAVLVEMGFISNIEDCNKLVQKPDIFASAIAKGICEYIGVKFIDREDGLTMSQYEELNERLSKLENKMIYNWIDENMPDWARPTIQKLVNKGILKGGNDGLNLDDRDLRMFVINDRAGLYDR